MAWKLLQVQNSNNAQTEVISGFHLNPYVNFVSRCYLDYSSRVTGQVTSGNADRRNILFFVDKFRI